MERTPQTSVGGQFGIKNKVNVGIKCLFFFSHRLTEMQVNVLNTGILYLA